MEEILNSKLQACCDLDSLVNSIQEVLSSVMIPVDQISGDLVDVEFLDDIAKTTSATRLMIYFGSSLRDIKCVYIDSNFREHEMCLWYKGKNRLGITSLELPSSSFQERDYRNLDDLIRYFKDYLLELNNYLYELENIDRFCTVVDPVRPTFKHGYRKIKLEDRVWLNLEVSLEGKATNIHLVGHCPEWQDVLQRGILNWDHDFDIVENVTQLHDLMQFSDQANRPNGKDDVEIYPEVTDLLCIICLCPELSETFGQPQPLCQNQMCTAYFHRHCLYQWLVASSGGRPPAFSVATGSCPACFQSIFCSERD